MAADHGTADPGSAARASYLQICSLLSAIGVPGTAADSWLGAVTAASARLGKPAPPSAADIELRALSESESIVASLPEPGVRSAAEQQAVEQVRIAARHIRANYLRQHARSVYRALTGDLARQLRVAELARLAADHFPGLVPSEKQIAAEHARSLRHKDGIEFDQAMFFAYVLEDDLAGEHLVASMRRPHPRTADYLDEFDRTGVAHLDRATVRRVNAQGHLAIQNGCFLNAEDASTNESLEIGVDLVLLQPGARIGVLRGGAVAHPKYVGKKVMSSGLNLTHLYHGKIPYLFFLERELGFVHKLYRGVLRTESEPASAQSGWPEADRDVEKPWIGVIESFAIGGSLQILLALDWVIGEEGAIMRLPAAVEGLVPGVSNMRVARFVGERGARRLLFGNKTIRVSDPEGQLLCDECVPLGQVEAAIDRVADMLLAAGDASFVANRRCLRAGVEPSHVFRAYMALYAREQACCLLSPGLPDRLEATWPAAARAAARPL